MELVVHFGEGLVGEAFFVAGLVRLWEASFAIGCFGEEAFAFDAAGEHPGHGIEETESVERVFLKGALEGVGAEIDESFAGEGDGNFWSGLIGIVAWLFGGEVLEELVSEAAFVAALLFHEEFSETAVGFPI